MGADSVTSNKQVTRTIDNTRETEETMVADGDEDVMGDEMEDVFSKFFNGDAAINRSNSQLPAVDAHKDLRRSSLLRTWG